MNAIAESFDAGDAEGFTAAVAEYDRYASVHSTATSMQCGTDERSRVVYRLTKLDQWKTGLLLQIKRQIAEEPSLT